MAEQKKSKHLRRSSVVPVENYAANALEAAKFHFNKINSIICEYEVKWREAPDKDKEQILQNPKLHQEVSWHIRAFFWELYSVFDFISHWANERFALEFTGNQIRWNDMYKCKRVSSEPDTWSLIKEVINQKRKQVLFSEIKEYRNFSHEGAPTMLIITDEVAGTWVVFIPQAIEGQTQFIDIRQQLPKYIAFTKESGRDIFLNAVISRN